MEYWLQFQKPCSTSTTQTDFASYNDACVPCVDYYLEAALNVSLSSFAYTVKSRI